MVLEKKDKLNEKNKEMESFKDELTYLRISVYREKIKNRTRRRLKFIKKKLLERKRKEAFPRKDGKYNELFQDFGKESGAHSNPTKTGGNG